VQARKEQSPVGNSSGAGAQYEEDCRSTSSGLGEGCCVAAKVVKVECDGLWKRGTDDWPLGRGKAIGQCYEVRVSCGSIGGLNGALGLHRLRSWGVLVA
jgi:hypothetical protein